MRRYRDAGSNLGLAEDRRTDAGILRDAQNDNLKLQNDNMVLRDAQTTSFLAMLRMTTSMGGLGRSAYCSFCSLAI